MPDYINREAVSLEIGNVPPRERNYRKAMDIVDTFPAADVVEVVRCRDCFYNAGESRDLWGNPVILCVTAVKHEPDWYCASGKRKDGGKDDGD